MALLTEADHRRVSDAVGEAERRSSGEIVTVLAERSDGYSDIALAWAALAAFTLLTLLAFVPHWPLDAYAGLHGSWNAEWPDGEIFAMAAMLVELKQGNIAAGMIAAIERVGVVLAEHFPREEDDVNELPDRLIEI